MNWYDVYNRALEKYEEEIDACNRGGVTECSLGVAVVTALFAVENDIEYSDVVGIENPEAGAALDFLAEELGVRKAEWLRNQDILAEFAQGCVEWAYYAEVNWGYFLDLVDEAMSRLYDSGRADEVGEWDIWGTRVEWENRRDEVLEDCGFREEGGQWYYMQEVYL